MSLSFALRTLRSKPTSINGYTRGLRRYSSAVGTGLPLEGIRVLDMTRVLAGVSLSPESLRHGQLLTPRSHIVLRFWAILGKSAHVRLHTHARSNMANEQR